MLSKRDFLRLSAKALIASGLAATVPITSELGATSAVTLRQSSKLLQLHYNENSLGMSPAALQAAIDATGVLGNRYADQPLDELREKLAVKHKVAGSQIIFGNGSTEVLQAVSRLAAMQDAVLVEPTPTFGALARYAKAQGMQVVKVPVSADFVTDIAAIEAQANQYKGAVLVNLCNPNNPTGTIVDSAALAAWIRRAPAQHIFLLDEAYLEYALQSPGYQSMLPLVLEGRENLVIARTFSKVFGMAGLRMGYGVAAPKTAAQLNALGADFNLNIAGIAAASASLDDQDFFLTSLKANAEAKQILLGTLDQLNLSYIPSHTNFVLHRINSDLQTYSQRMRDNSVKVGRRMTAEDGWNRLSLGTPDDMREFSQLLLKFREQGWV
ncbi:pyridoxal phosphate-dependent aminotransferase [Alteromonas flava]|uniref:pyridoxal phosphate-dependent aminotransferase n=1 Tax=Alteromonas flava TaxID=2048003 RepID=UPI000C28341F|nr:histidinol-phosphate transaminase [Alteromonas flava]